MLQTHSFVIPLHAKLQRDVSCIKRKDVTLFNPCLCAFVNASFRIEAQGLTFGIRAINGNSVLLCFA